jgi:hypothetical protein
VVGRERSRPGGLSAIGIERRIMALQRTGREEVDHDWYDCFIVMYRVEEGDDPDPLAAFMHRSGAEIHIRNLTIHSENPVEPDSLYIHEVTYWTRHDNVRKES